MDDPWYKLRCLWPCIRQGIGLRFWWTQIWRRDLRQRICCDGRECGCYGADGYAEIDCFVLGKRF